MTMHPLVFAGIVIGLAMFFYFVCVTREKNIRREAFKLGAQGIETLSYRLPNTEILFVALREGLVLLSKQLVVVLKQAQESKPSEGRAKAIFDIETWLEKLEAKKPPYLGRLGWWAWHVTSTDSVSLHDVNAHIGILQNLFRTIEEWAKLLDDDAVTQVKSSRERYNVAAHDLNMGLNSFMIQLLKPRDWRKYIRLYEI